MNTARAVVRTFASSSVRRVAGDQTHPGYAKVRPKFFNYQIDNGQPIHLKGGVVDTLLFMTTLGLNAVGLAMCLQFFYSMSFPKKAD